MKTIFSGLVHGEDEYGLYAGIRVGKYTQIMRAIRAGSFMMGSPEGEHERFPDELLHNVSLTEDFWLADTACTQGLWKEVMGWNPSRFKRMKRPVETVSWDDVQEFLARLNQRVPGLNATLPTEAQWEYACRAGTTTPFGFGETVDTDQANFDGNYPYRAQDTKGQYRGQMVDVKALPPNPWGLYQMDGNVWEWCLDGPREYTQDSVVDPLGPQDDGPRVLRGGSWCNDAGYLRCASRDHGCHTLRSGNFGFRIAMKAITDSTVFA